MARVDKYLLLRQYLVPNTDKAGLVDLFLVSMFRRGELRTGDLSRDPTTAQFGNVVRLQKHLQALYSTDEAQLDAQEARQF